MFISCIEKEDSKQVASIIDKCTTFADNLKYFDGNQINKNIESAIKNIFYLIMYTLRSRQNYAEADLNTSLKRHRCLKKIKSDKMFKKIPLWIKLTPCILGLLILILRNCNLSTYID